MSIIPYNNFTVRDLSNVLQPYVNSSTEFGYFSGESSVTIANGLWRSLPAVLNTNNGIAMVDVNGGLTIRNSGIYSINLSLFPITTQDGSSNISFNFGTRYLVNDPSTNIVNAFGGLQPIGMNTYDPSNNPYSPGIISWLADGYSSANSTMSNFVKNPMTYELSYNYNNAGYPNGGSLYSGNCTGETTFILDSSATIFFNVSTNSSAGVTMGNSSFTLKLISSPFTVPSKTWRWNRTSASILGYRGVASSGTGQYLAACNNSSTLYISSDYGASWNTKTVSAGTIFIAISLDGSILLTAPYGAIPQISRNYGANWGAAPGVPSGQWISAYVSGSGQYLALGKLGGTPYVSSNYGFNFSPVTSPAGVGYVTISNDGRYLSAGTDGNDYSYSSTNFGGTWTQSSIGTRNWRNFSTSVDGKYVVAGGSTNIFTSSNYGVTMNSILTMTNNATSSASSSNGQYLFVSISGNIYTSSNYGATWFLQSSNGLPAAAWEGVASSSNGSRVVAIVKDGSGIFSGIYIGVLS